MSYDGKHSVTFYGGPDFNDLKNTWEDWQLIPMSRPTINPPPVQDFSITVPGRSGKIDFRKSVLPHPAYDNRVGSLEFIVDHDSDDYIRWNITYDKIMEFLHGETLRMVLDDEPDVYYEGVFSINEFKSNSDWSTITIDYDVKPYKNSIISSLDAWKWDPFSFVTGYIRKPSNYKISINAGQGAVLNEIIHVPGESTVTVSTDSKKIFTVVSYLINGESQRYFVTDKTEYKVSFTVYPEHPYFLISSTSVDNVDIYINFTEGRI